MTDGNDNFDDAILTITVTGANDAPIISALTITTNEDIATSGQLVASDLDASDTLTFSVDGTPANGSVIVNAGGSFTYTPNANFNGTDSFDVVIDDGNGGTDTETVTVTVNAENDAPTLVDAPLGFGVFEDVLSPIDLSDIVVGDVDSNVTLTLSVDQGTLSANGGGVIGGVTVVEVNATTVTVFGAPEDVTTFLDGTSAISYQGPLNLAGNNVATLTYSLSDGVAPAVTDTSNITLIAVNDDPTQTGLPADVSVTENTESNVDLSGFTLADVDSADHIVTITVDTGVFTTVAAGSVVGPGLTVTLSTANFQTISLIGTPADINTYLNNPANITYTGLVGVLGDDAAEISVFANDGDGSGAVPVSYTHLTLPTILLV